MDFDFQNKLKIEAGNDLMMMMMLQMEKMLPENANVSSPGLPGEDDHEGSFCRVNNGVRSGVGGAVTSLPPAFYDHVQQSSFMGNSSTTSSSDAPGGIPFLPPEEIKRNSSMAVAMREMIFRVAAMQPVHIDPESVRPPKRRNVKISKDPQSVAARHRRERISERIRILQRLVPGGTKMDTASMLDEAVHYVKFLKKQVQSLEKAGAVGFPPPAAAANLNYVSLMRACQLGSLQSCRDSSC